MASAFEHDNLKGALVQKTVFEGRHQPPIRPGRFS